MLLFGLIHHPRNMLIDLFCIFDYRIHSLLIIVDLYEDIIIMELDNKFNLESGVYILLYLLPRFLISRFDLNLLDILLYLTFSNLISHYLTFIYLILLYLTLICLMLLYVTLFYLIVHYLIVIYLILF